MDFEFWSALAFVWTLWSVTWWGAIKVVDRYNAQNRFGVALAWGLFQVAIAICIAWLSLFGLGLNAIFLVFLLKLLVYSYELDLLRSLGVTIASFVVPYYVGQWMLEQLERDRSFAMFVIYAFPVAVIAAWRLARKHERAAEEPSERAEMPVAQVRRMLTSVTKRRPPKPIAPVAPPVKPVPPTPPPAADGGPRLLR